MTGPGWFSELAEDWLRALRRRGRSQRTLDNYAWLCRELGAWLEHCRMERPQDLIPAVLYSWQDTLQEHAPATRALASVVLRGLLRWAAREGRGVPPELWLHVDQVQRPRRKPRALEPDDLAQLLRHYAERGKGFEQLRDRALFLFLLTTGSRIAAALSLDVAQARSGRLVVRQKGGDEHVLVPSATASGWLEQYLQARGRDQQAALWIRIGRRGRHRLSDWEVNRIWERTARRLGIAPFVSHQLRHTAATELGELGISDTELAHHLGWRNNAMAMVYRDLRGHREQQLVDQLDRLLPDVAAAPASRPRRRVSARVIRGKR